jgi:hypothetical protein
MYAEGFGFLKYQIRIIAQIADIDSVFGRRTVMVSLT